MKLIRQDENEAAELIRGYMKQVFGFALNRVKQRMEADNRI